MFWCNTVTSWRSSQPRMIDYVQCIYLNKAFIYIVYVFGATLWRVGARLSREWLAMYSVYLNKAFYIVYVLVQHCDELALVSAENDWLCQVYIFRQGIYIVYVYVGATLWRVGARLSREWLAMYSVYLNKVPFIQGFI